MDAASATPHTISSWVVIALPFVMGIVGWLVSRLIKSVDDLRASGVVNTQALAVLLTRVDPMSAALARNIDDTNDLKQETAILREVLNRHEAWATREHERINHVIDAHA